MGVRRGSGDPAPLRGIVFIIAGVRSGAHAEFSADVFAQTFTVTALKRLGEFRVSGCLKVESFFQQRLKHAPPHQKYYFSGFSGWNFSEAELMQ